MLDNNYKRKNVIYLLIISIMLVFSIATGISYSLWSLSVSQGNENSIDMDCFKITINDSNDISLIKAYPISDGKGSQLTPYTFTIKNICKHAADYQINLETINTSTLRDHFVKIKFDNQNPVLYAGNRQVQPTLNDASNAFRLKEGTLAKDAEETHDLRIWVDESATLNDAENKIFKSKITITTTLNVDGTVKGDLKNITLHTFGGTLDGAVISSTENAPIGNLPVPNKDGYKFLEWYSDEELTHLVTGSTIVTSELNDLYAKYGNGYYELTFNPNKGTLNTEGLSTKKGEKKIIEHSSNVDDSGTRLYDYMPNLSGENAEVKHISFGKTVNAHLKLTYGTESASYDWVCVFAGNVTPANNDNCSSSLSNKLYGYGSSYNKPKATWEADINASEITIYFKTDYARNNYYGYYLEASYEDDVKYKDINNNEEYGTLPEVERENYDFLGWYIGDNKITSQSIVDTTENVEATAKWKSKYSTLASGQKFNAAIKTLLRGYSTTYTSIYNSNITFVRSDSLQNTSTVVSDLTSQAPIFIWRNSGKLYWYSEADTVYLNPDSSYMFYNFTGLTNIDLSQFNASNVENMNHMFSKTTSLTSLDLSTVNTTNVTDMSSMFEDSTALEKIYVGSNWNTSNVTSSTDMFKNTSSIVGGSGTVYDELNTDVDYAHIDGGETNPGYLTDIADKPTE